MASLKHKNTPELITEHPSLTVYIEAHRSTPFWLTLPGDDKHSDFNAPGHFQAALHRAAILFQLFVKSIMINTEDSTRIVDMLAGEMLPRIC